MGGWSLCLNDGRPRTPTPSSEWNAPRCGTAGALAGCGDHHSHFVHDVGGGRFFWSMEAPSPAAHTAPPAPRNPTIRTGAYGQTRQGRTRTAAGARPASSAAISWASTQRTTNNGTGVTKPTTQSSAGSSARVTGPGGSTTAVAKRNSGDLYAGYDGNVYKKDSSGGYQKYDNGSWSNVQQPTQAQKQQAQSQASARAAGASANSATISQVKSDAAARTQGAQRTNTYSRGGGSSYRPSGGAGSRRR